MTDPPHKVFVVDDDVAIREAIGSLLFSVGLDVELFASPHAFLKSKPPEGPACLILDIRLPGLSGLDLQKQLARSNLDLPIVFITAHGDIPMTVAAMKGGAVEFLTKPFRDQELLDAVQAGIARDRAHRRRQVEITNVRDRYANLTAREREVLRLVAAGKLNKQIAGALGVSEITVKVHRAQMMRKMEAPCLIDLVRMVDLLAPVGSSR
jgi:FixJ family two-component response regulator